MEDRNKLLGTAPILPLVLKLAIPTILAQLVNALYNIVDRIYLGNIPEEGALILTGVGITFPIIQLISAFAAFIGAGGAPLAAISLGANNKEKANKILNQGFVSLISISIVLTTFFFIFKEKFLFMFGASENTFIHANEYISIYLIGTIFVQLTIGLNVFITAQGFAKQSMTTILIGAFTNIILDPIFIFGFGLGAKGAAFATIISQALAAFWVLRFLRSKKSILRFDTKLMMPSKKILLPVFALGLSPFIMQATEAAINIVFNSTLQAKGGDMAVGVMTILSSIMMFLFLPLSGLGQGAQPILSYNFGANNNERVIKTFKVLLTFCLTYTLGLQLLLMLFPQIPIRLFTNDNELASFAVPYLKIFFAGFGFFGLQSATQQMLLALGQSKLSLFLAVLRKIILLIPLVYILSNTTLGVTGVFLAEPISDSISALTAITLLLFNIKKILKRGPSA